MFFRKYKRTIENILVVEDEPLVAFDNELHLADAGYKVVATVDTVTDALAWIEREQVHLVVADIKLSNGGSGVDVAKAAHDRDIPVLFATGDCPSVPREFGAGCLQKPFAAGQLVRSVQAIDLMIRGEKVRDMPRALTLFSGDDG